MLGQDRRARLSAAVASGVVLLLAVTALVVRADDDPRPALQVAGAVTTTTSSVASTTGPQPQAATTSPTTSAPDSRVPAPASPSTTRPRSSAPTTTGTTVTRPPRPTIATTPTSPRSTLVVRNCTASEALVTAAPDESSYPAGSIVDILVEAENRSSRPCPPFDPRVEIRSAGTTVGGAAVAGVFTRFVPGEPLPVWEPGETLSHYVGWFAVCPDGAPCPPGSYTATALVGNLRSSPATFTIT